MVLPSEHQFVGGRQVAGAQNKYHMILKSEADKSIKVSY